MWNWSENQIRLALIRHGAAKWNMEHRYLGRTDKPLCPEGTGRLLEMKAENDYPKVECLFISPMKRCMETAEILYPNQKPIIIAEWEEMDFGVFEGKNYVELQGDRRYQAWIDSNGRLPFPEGEDREHFNHRCAMGFQKMTGLLSQLTEENPDGIKTAGIIVHGGTIMSLLSQYGGGEYFDYQVSNGRGYLCTLSGSKITNIELMPALGGQGISL